MVACGSLLRGMGQRVGTCSWEPCAFKFLVVHPMLGAQLSEGSLFSWHSGSSSPGVGRELEGES